MNGCKVTTPAHTTAMGIYGALGYYENGPSRGGPGRYPECQPQAVDVCEGQKGELAGPGEHAGVGTRRRRMGAIHGCHAATTSIGAGPFFFKLVEPLPLTFFFPPCPRTDSIPRLDLYFISVAFVLSNCRDVFSCSLPAHQSTCDLDAAQNRDN